MTSIREDSNQRRRSTDETSMAKILGLTVVAISIVGAVFTAGWNWRSISNIEANQNDYVRKDVQGQQLQNITDRLGDLSRQLEQMRSEVAERERRRP